jgi:hypothetical protein
VPAQPKIRAHLGGRVGATALLVLLGGASLLLTPSRLGGDRLFAPGVVVAIVAAGWVALALALFTMWRSASWRFIGLAALIVAVVVVPTAAFVAYRSQTGIPVHVQDGSYQTEIAAAGLLQGRDPYGGDFAAAGMARWPMYSDPALSAGLHHYPYSPLTVLYAIPVVVAAGLAGLPPDLRPLLLLTGGLAFWIILRLPWPWTSRYMVATLLFLNPLMFWQDGRNDSLWLAALIAAVGLAASRRWTLACWALGISAAFKLFALPYLPLMGLLLLMGWRERHLDGRAALLGGLGLVVPIVITVAPFLAWSPAAFIGDTVGFTSMAGPHGYPIRGYGLSVLLLSAGILPSPYAAFPFGLLQAAVGTVLLGLAGLMVLARPRFSAVLDGGAAVAAGVLFCSLQFSDNYFASLLVLFAIALATRAIERQAPTLELRAA